MSSYNLTEEDIYRPNVVRNMIHLLDMRINTFCDTENLKYNQMWLDSLVDKRRRVQKTAGNVGRYRQPLRQQIKGIGTMCGIQ